MKPNQIQTIAEMLTDHPDVFVEDMGSGPMGSGGMSGNISKSTPSTPTKRTADAPTTQEPPNSEPNKPLNATDIQKSADEAGGSPAAADVVADQMKQQQEMEKQAQLERQKILQPQFAQLNTSMSKLQDGVLQGKQAATSGGEQFGDLEKEMTSLNTLLGNLQKQI